MPNFSSGLVDQMCAGLPAKPSNDGSECLAKAKAKLAACFGPHSGATGRYRYTE